jgi:L-cysteine:1D-myo-inositol 2-amino-2-deoxy-alpha-D-glucopyranoside ligase
MGNRWTAHFIYDMRLLNVRPPDYLPRATDMILPIIDATQALLAAGVAYQSGGNVYFHVDAWPEFGQLSHIPRADMLPVANERGNHPDDPHKRDPLDFVLWQAQAAGEPAWDSPWGLGRPGWHIECSTMVAFFLGERIDIHGGGADLIFPHHECETAQAEAITGQKPFVRCWMHTAMVYHQGEKMSKSLGNLVMVRDLLQSWTPDTLRLYLGQHHYRQSWSHDEAELNQAEHLAQKLYQAVTVYGGSGEVLDPTPALLAFQTAMDNDLDTPTALEALSILAEQVLSTAAQEQEVTAAQEALRQMGRVFGLRLDAPSAEGRVMAGWEEHLQRFAEV